MGLQERCGPFKIVDEENKTSKTNAKQTHLFEDFAIDFAGDVGESGRETGILARDTDRLLLELIDESLFADAAAAFRGGIFNNACTPRWTTM
jgi:hypothetical protein